jgi:predicted nucleic acid-binding protein
MITAFAELAPAEQNADKLAARLEKFVITYNTISPNSAYLAGTIFKRYRLAGGPRMHLIPDFLIAAHATIQADRLAAIDRGYLRSWFPNLRLLTPGATSS